jgi:hypothetical protein
VIEEHRAMFTTVHKRQIEDDSAKAQALVAKHGTTGFAVSLAENDFKFVI